MDVSEILVPALSILTLVALQSFATWRVWRSDLYERAQKIAQTRLIWLMPLVGAVIVLVVLNDTAGRV